MASQATLTSWGVCIVCVCMCVTKWMTCRKSVQNMIGFPLCGKLSRSDSTLVWICHVVDWRGEACERPLRPRCNDTRDRAQLVVYEWARVSPRDRKKSVQNGEQTPPCSRPGHRPPPHPFSHTQTACTCVCVYIEREKRTNQRTHKYVVRRGSYNCNRSRSHSHSQQQDEQYR